MKYIVSAYSGLGNTVQLSSIIGPILESDKKAEITFISDNNFGQLDFLELIEGINIQRHGKSFSLSNLVSLWKIIKNFEYLVLPYVGTPIMIQLASYLTGKTIYQHEPISWNKAKFLLYFFKIFNHKIILVPANAEVIEEVRYLNLIEDFVRPSDTHREIKIDLTGQESIFKKFKVPTKYICVQVGGANGGKTPKVWPKENVIEFLRIFLNSMPNCSVILLGDKLDKEKYDIDISGAINLIGKTSIVELVNILNSSMAVICNDSSLLHLSNLFRLKTYVLLGPTLKEFPESGFIETIKADLPCMPCLDGLKFSEEEALDNCPINNLCMKLVSPEIVLEKLTHHIQNS